jgi:hypothetical protein
MPYYSNAFLDELQLLRARNDHVYNSPRRVLHMHLLLAERMYWFDTITEEIIYDLL